MVVLVIGAGRTGAQVLRQLKKNPAITIRTLDPRENPGSFSSSAPVSRSARH